MVREVTAIYDPDDVALDLTDYLAEVKGGTSGRSVETSTSIILNLRDEALTLVLDEEKEYKVFIGGVPSIRAWITAIDRGYVGDGVPHDNIPSLSVTGTDIYGRLKRRDWPPLTSGLKRKAGDTAADRMAWLIGKVNHQENVEGRPDLLVYDAGGSRT